MSFTEAVRTCLRKYADFGGRAGRPEFWWFVLFCLLVFTVATNVDRVFDLYVRAYGVTTLVVELALVVPFVAAQVRRLHDLGKPGWWAFGNLALCLGTLVLLVVLSRPGVPEGNRHGPRP